MEGSEKIILEEKAKMDMSANTLKIIAIILMLVDHAAAGILSHDTMLGMLLRIPGRVVDPIMCYFIAEGYFNTSNLKQYMMRLGVFAVISHTPYNLYFGFKWWEATSVIWGLFLGLVGLAAAKKEAWPHWAKILIIGLCCLLAVPANWNYVSVLWIVAFGLFRGQFKKQIAAFLLIGCLFHILPAVVNQGWVHCYQVGILLSIPLLAAYKGRRGKKSKVSKWGFYLFYPAHLLLLYTMRILGLF